VGVLPLSLSCRSHPFRLSPEVLEPGRRHLGVPHRVLDVAVSEVGLQRPGVVARIGEGKAASGNDGIPACQFPSPNLY
jgi:hypothetical protein